MTLLWPVPVRGSTLMGTHSWVKLWEEWSRWERYHGHQRPEVPRSFDEKTDDQKGTWNLLQLLKGLRKNWRDEEGACCKLIIQTTPIIHVALNRYAKIYPHHSLQSAYNYQMLERSNVTNYFLNASVNYDHPGSHLPCNYVRFYLKPRMLTGHGLAVCFNLTCRF